MTTRLLVLLSISLLGALASTPSAQAQGGASFTGLGDLPGGITRSVATAVSGDGSVVVGHSASASGNSEAFRWDAVNGMTSLGDLSGGPFESFANDVSRDGSVIVGRGAASQGYEAAVWTESRWSLGCGMSGGNCYGETRGVAPDGSVVVGDLNTKAFIYDNVNDVRLISDLGGGGDSSVANDVTTGDGWTAVVGRGTSAWGQEAFFWEEIAGQSAQIWGLGDLPGGSFFSDALAVSADGYTSVGLSMSENGYEACVWDLLGEPLPLGDLPGGGFYSEAYGVSGEGGVVVGKGLTDNGFEAFVSTYADGMRRLSTVLEDEHELDLAGWTLTEARGISDDGRVIVGNGTNPDGAEEAWRAVLPAPEPSMGSLGLSVAIALGILWRSGPRLRSSSSRRRRDPGHDMRERVSRTRKKGSARRRSTWLGHSSTHTRPRGGSSSRAVPGPLEQQHTR